MPKVTEAHSAARRQQIIDAAYRCFARKGFHQTTMRDIYAEANLSPGAVYHYFDSKDAIIQASFEFDFQRSRALFEAAVASDDPLKALHELLDFFFHGLEGAAALGATRVNVQGWGEAQAAGQIERSLDPRSVGRMLLSLYYGLELQKALDTEVEVDTYAAAIKTLLFSVSQPT